MADICALHPWVKAQNRPSNGKKIKSILVLSTMCSFFAHRYMPDKHTNDTRFKNVIYLRHTTEYSNVNYYKTTHHNVLLNTEMREMYPYTSPEGAKRLPPRGDDWRQRKRTLGAAMRLKALRQASPEISRQTNPPQAKEKRQ